MLRSSLTTIALLAAVSLIALPGCKSRQAQDSAGRVDTTDGASINFDSSTQPTTRMARDLPMAAKPSADGFIKGTLAYPTGDRKTSALLLEKSVPGEVIANKPYEYTIKVTNLTPSKLKGIEITETLPVGLKLADAVSGATLHVDGQTAKIGIGELAAGESRTIKIGATATQAGAVSGCSAVSYNTNLCLGLNVVSPALTANATLPADVLLCDRIPLKITVTNSGTGTAKNIKVTDTLPEGLLTADGRQELSIDVGSLAAGESRTVEVLLKASKTGSFQTQLEAQADDIAVQAVAAAVVVRQPKLVVSKSGPKNIFVGVPFTYELEIENRGDGIARQAVLTDNLPDSLRVIKVSEGGTIAGGRVTWQIGDLAPGAKKKVTLEVEGNNVGTALNSVTGQAECADPATVSAETQISGVPAILLEVVDSPDPVRVGEETTYIITVTNQGSAPSTNVKIVGVLENNMEFVSAAGASAGKLDGTNINFEPLASLAPGATAKFTVVIKASGSDDVRFKTVLTADQFKRSIEETESTNFYK